MSPPTSDRERSNFSRQKMLRRQDAEHLLLKHRHNHSSTSSGLTTSTASSSTSMMSLSSGEQTTLPLNSAPITKEEPISMMLLKQDSFRGFGDDDNEAGFGDFGDENLSTGKGKQQPEIATGKEEWSKHGFAISKAKLVHMLSSRNVVTPPPNATPTDRKQHCKGVAPSTTKTEANQTEEDGESCFSLIKQSSSQHGRRRGSLSTIVSNGTDGGATIGGQDDFEVRADESMGDFSVPVSKLVHMLSPTRAREPPLDEDSDTEDDDDDDDNGHFSFIKPSSSQHGRRRASLCTIEAADNSDGEAGNHDFEFGGDDDSIGDFGTPPTLSPQSRQNEKNTIPVATSGFSISRMKVVRMMSLRGGLSLLQADDTGNDLQISIQPSKKVRKPGEPRLEIVDDDDHVYDADKEARPSSPTDSLSNEEFYNVALASELKQLPSKELASRYIEMQKEVESVQQQKLLERLSSSSSPSFGEGVGFRRRSCSHHRVGDGDEKKNKKGDRRKKHSRNSNQKKSSSLSSIEVSGETERKRSPKSSKKTKGKSSSKNATNSSMGEAKATRSNSCSPASNRRRKSSKRRSRSPKNRTSPRIRHQDSAHTDGELDEEELIRALGLDENALSMPTSIKHKRLSRKTGTRVKC